MSTWVIAGLCLVAIVVILLRRRSRARTDEGPTFPLSLSTESTIKEVRWPPLPVIESNGRVATPEDVERGNAVFAIEQVTHGTPRLLMIPLPQYAFHVDKEIGVRRPVIVVQAEAFHNTEVIGYRGLDGKSSGAGLREEFELLGTELQVIRSG